MNKISSTTLLKIAFIALELIIYTVFMVIDILGTGDTTALKYAGVLLCMAFCLVPVKSSTKDSLVVFSALAFTAVSDLFLLVLNSNYEIGLITFIVAQLIYFYRIYSANGKKPFTSILIRVLVPLIIIIVLACLQLLDLLTALVAVYFPQLVINAVDSAFILKQRSTYVLFFVGLLLFICCDICVGLNNFSSVLRITLPTLIREFVAVGMWAFYLPSQVLIALSVTKKRS